MIDDLANTVDLDETAHEELSHLVLQCFLLDFEFSVLIVQFELKVDLQICGLPAFLSLYGLSDYISEVVR